MAESVLRREVIFAVALYCFCSSTLLFLNKLAVTELAIRPGAIVVIQIAIATVLCMVLGSIRVIPLEGAFEWRRVKLFSVYVLAFVGSIYSSAMALRQSNVETVIVFRASTPLAVSVLEYAFLGRAAPSLRSTLALVGTALSSLAYVATDAQFVLEGAAGYAWCFIYFNLVCFEFTFGKHLVSKSVRTGVWESVFLTNTLALPVLCLLASANGDLDDLPAQLAALDLSRAAVLALSSLVAFSIGYAGWLCRSLVAATTYTLIGVCNKLFTVVLAVLFLDKHASNLGLLALVACILSSSFYSQAPLRDDPRLRSTDLADKLVQSPPDDAETPPDRHPLVPHRRAPDLHLDDLQPTDDDENAGLLPPDAVALAVAGPAAGGPPQPDASDDSDAKHARPRPPPVSAALDDRQPRQMR
mmetsp:Transcript_12046/g.38373  ORF Transcript_12046/g.38373 Transcript_12046/m.38373 type:complete len:414 (-) Transcript_12046:241-1482(-)